MAPPNVFYEFGEFRLDRGERVLRRADLAVPLTPKATEILLTLLERPGHIVEKADLMRQVWPDTAVEESNLTQNIYTLRRVLGTGDGKSAFIETVPRRGYRFVGSVRIAGDAESVTVLADPGVANAPGDVRPRSPLRVVWMGAAIVSGAAVIAALLSMASNRPRDAAPTTELTLPLIRLTNVGTVVRATVSSDGRSLVYALLTGSRESLWAKSLDSASPVQLIEPAVGTYRRGGGLSSAPDGWVYYTWFRPDLAAVGMFRIRQHGSPPERLHKLWDLPAFDPRGNRFACITITSSPVGESRLLVYDDPGRPPSALAVHAPPVSFLQMQPAWSPDGKQLAAWIHDERTPGVRGLVIVDVDGGRQRVVSKQRFHTVDGMVWLADGASVVVAAREAASAPLRLWQVDVGSGSMRRLTADISDYLLAGLTGEGRQLAAVRADVARTLWVAPSNEPSRARQIASDAGEMPELESIAWMPHGRLLYTSTESGNADIWLYDPSSGERRQLTRHPRDDFNPASSPDGRVIVFSSDRSDATGLWSMSDAGESSVRQLSDAGDFRPSISRDGTVVFQRGVIKSAPVDLWRMPLGGGPAVRLTHGVSIRPAVSPDGRLVAHYFMTPERWTLATVPIQGGERLHVFPLSPSHCGRTVRWSPDGRALAYIDCEDGAANIWLRPLDGGPARRLTNLRSGHIATFDWSPDGSQLAWVTRTQVSDVVLMDSPGSIPRQ